MINWLLKGVRIRVDDSYPWYAQDEIDAFWDHVEAEIIKQFREVLCLEKQT